MTSAETGGTWQGVREKTGDFNRQSKSGFDMRPFWRGKAFSAHRNDPAPLMWARVFAGVLDNIGLHTYEGEALVGSRAGFVVETLPEDISEGGYRAAVAVHDAHGRRDFWAGWDHTLADYPALLEQGIQGFLKRIAVARTVHNDIRRRENLDAMAVTLEALARFILRHVALTDDAELAAGLCHIAANPPRDFREALQLVWLTHIGFVSQGRCSNALGRLDQYLYPWYRRGRNCGQLTDDKALDLLCHLWARIEELGEVTNICVGGLNPDGGDATNELTYLCIEATRRVQSPHTNLSARFHDTAPDAFYRACFACIQTGVGFPAIFNDHVLLEGLAEIGIPDEVARDYCMVGCIETMLPGRQQAWSDSRFNTPGFMLKALQRLRREGAPSWGQLQAFVQEEIAVGLADHVERVNAHIAQSPATQFPDPFLSALTNDCIARGLDINDGGAEYARFHGIAIMGLATVSDSLAALRKLVLEDKRVSLNVLWDALDGDFFGHEPLRQMLLNRAPSYGNDERYVDDIAAWVVRITSEECLKHRVHGGGRFVAAMAANISNISAGREIGATPDGRHAGVPISDAASPFYGRDRQGPTALLHSVSRPDYHLVLTGSVINMKFEPEFFLDEEGARRFLALMRFFVRERIPELQFNFTGTDLLSEARANPEQYDNLVVRVSGFSEYFTRLSRAVQDDIIRRRAHGA